MADESRTASREQIAALLWPDAEVEVGRARLRRLIYKTNHALGAAVIAADRESISIAHGVDIDSDAHRFERLLKEGRRADAIELYTDDYLSGFLLDEAEDFSEWLFYRREALRCMYLHALERLAEAGLSSDSLRLSYLQNLVAADPFNEAGHRKLISAFVAAGDSAAAERQLSFCKELLNRELGVDPEPETLALLTGKPAAPSSLPTYPHYVLVDGAHIAWQTVGDGPVDVVVVPGFVSHLDRAWDDAHCRRWLEAARGIGRLILFDRRGMGLSDRIGSPPTNEATARDIAAVMAAAQSQRAILFGASEGGPGCIRFAADHPESVAALFLWGSLAKGCRSPDYPHALSRQQYDLWLSRLIGQWGGPAEIEIFAPGLANDPNARAWWASLLRAASSPSAIRDVLMALRDVDVRDALGHIKAPTVVMHRTGDQAVRREAGRYLADNIPGARFHEFDGEDHWFWAGDQRQSLGLLSAFVESRSLSQGMRRGRRTS